ncbi:MAG: hypothetical protein JWP57_4628, partial [Spirosoma sp.]|nr:hypothetical protein [Spirosoma sp.]
ATVTALSPPRNARAASRTTNVTLTLDKNWPTSTAGQQALTVWSQQGGGKKAGTATVSGNSLSFDPTTDFKPGETIFATATRASGLAKAQVYQFTTAAASAPATFATGYGVGVGNTPNSVVAADVDGDGDLDILTANGRSNSVSVRPNNGNGTFAAGFSVNVGESPQSVVAADVDGDGDLDILTANGNSNDVSVRPNNGDGTFATGFDVAVGSNPYSVVAADVDGDGDLDILTINAASRDVSVRPNNGDGTFTTGSEVAAGNAYSVVAADVDGDGDLDILTANQTSNNVSVRPNNGDGTFANGSNVAVGSGPHSVVAADVDGDGDLDILTANQTSNDVSVRLNQPAPIPPTPIVAPLKPVVPVAHVGITVAGVTSQPGNGPNQLHGPRGIFVDDSRAVYVADQVNNRIMKFPRGSSMGTSGTIVAGGNDYGANPNQLGYPTGVAVDGLGAIYVADSAFHRVKKFPPGSSMGTSGTIVAGGRGQGPAFNQLNSPKGLFVIGAGAVYVTDSKTSRVQKWTPTPQNDTTIQTVAGGNGFGPEPNRVATPSGVFVDRDMTVYVADSANHRIQKWLPGAREGITVAGNPEGRPGNGANELDSPSGVFVDELGAIYVADTRNHRIQKWPSGPTSGTTIAGGSKGSGANQLNSPSGVYVDGDGAVYVADQGNDRIQMFIPVHSGSGGLLGGPVPGPPPPPGLQLVAPLYDCPTGAFSFQTSGGNGSGSPAAPIEYMAAGITGWTTNPNQFVDFELRQAADAQPITLMVRQNGQTVRYVWDIRATCPVGAPNQLRLVAPRYDCFTGAITFQTQGGSATPTAPIEYMATGITGWTTNPNQFVDVELRQAADAQPITLMVRQLSSTGSYIQDSYLWDMRAICPVSQASARLGAGGREKGVAWRAVVYPNPVGQEVSVAIEGAQHQTVRLKL